VFRREKRQHVVDAEKHWLSSTLVLRKVNGYWFACSVRPFPDRFERGDDPWRWDYAEGEEINRSKAYDLYRRMVYCVSKRQLSRRELKSRGLRNDPAPAGLFASRARLAKGPTESVVPGPTSVCPSNNFQSLPGRWPDYRRRQL
jgi:hypothetical protein